MKNMNVVLSFKEISSRKFQATATSGKTSANGDGSSLDVAAARAVQNLVLYTAEGEPNGPTDIATDQTYYISAGKRVGESCAFVKIVAVLDDTEIWEVEYLDGTRGREKSKFLERTKR
jgi:hypothetical protein